MHHPFFRRDTRAATALFALLLLPALALAGAPPARMPGADPYIFDPSDIPLQPTFTRMRSKTAAEILAQARQGTGHSGMAKALATANAEKLAEAAAQIPPPLEDGSGCGERPGHGRSIDSLAFDSDRADAAWSQGPFLQWMEVWGAGYLGSRAYCSGVVDVQHIIREFQQALGDEGPAS